jgi:hypothetical protein
MGLKKTQKGKYLTLKTPKRVKPEDSYRSGIFLCQWHEKDFPLGTKQITNNKKLPFELERFSIDKRAEKV